MQPVSIYFSFVFYSLFISYGKKRFAADLAEKP